MAQDGGLRARFGDAAGLAALRPGFGLSPDDDARFALGWPHVRYVVDGHRDDEDPPTSARRVLLGGDPVARIAWPRRASLGLVRAWGLPSVYELAPGVRDLRPEAEEAVWNTDPLGADEAITLVRRRLTADAAGLGERAAEVFTLLAEALVGPEVVGGAIVDTLDTMSVDGLLTDWVRPAMVSHQLGYLLLRVPEPVAAGWRARLAAVLERVYAEAPTLRKSLRSSGATHARSIHLALGGGAAAEADTDRSPRWYTHTTDDPTLVRMRVALDRLGHEPDARLVFLGGPDVLARYARAWPSLRSREAQAWFLEQVSPIRGDEAAGIVLAMTARSQVRAEALAWFRARGPEGDAWLGAVAKGDGPGARWAQEARKALAG